MTDRDQRSTCWSITVNNPTKEDYAIAQNLPSWVKSFEGQEEIGAEGTKHIQGMLLTKSVKFYQVKNLYPRAHIEVARKPAALAKYVHKDDTRVATLDTQNSIASIDLAGVIKQIWPTYNDWELSVQSVISKKSDQEFIKFQSGEWTLDQIIKYLISEGNRRVEYLGANPAVRMAWKKFYKEMLQREYKIES